MLAADLDILARTAWGEARSQGVEGMIYVCLAILNRWRTRHRREHTIAGVCTEPWQFSCWNPDDPNREKLLSVGLSDAYFRGAYIAALSAFEMLEGGEDPTKGSDHYQVIGTDAKWSRGKAPAFVHGDHEFFNDIA